MSARNGDKARHEKNRKRAVLRRMKVREMRAAATAAAGTEPAPRRRIKPPLPVKTA
jgi:hypothetical protein